MNSLKLELVSCMPTDWAWWNLNQLYVLSCKLLHNPMNNNLNNSLDPPPHDLTFLISDSNETKISLQDNLVCKFFWLCSWTVGKESSAFMCNYFASIINNDKIFSINPYVKEKRKRRKNPTHDYWWKQNTHSNKSLMMLRFYLIAIK